MAARPPSPAAAHRQASGPLTDILITLAGTPDDDPRIAAYLRTIAQLSADQVEPVSYASITTRQDGAYTTVAASSELATAIDRAQYVDQAGPCLDALSGAAPVAVPDISTTMSWPGFRDTAFSLGLRASLSIPLFAGRGAPIAALNLYGHDPAAMSPLTAAVWTAYDTPSLPAPDTGTLRRTGTADLVAGLVAALAVRDLIHRAIGVIIAAQRETPDGAYRSLRLRATEAGVSLAETATALIGEPR